MTEPRRRSRRRSTDNDKDLTEFLRPDPIEPLPQDTLPDPTAIATKIANDDLDPIRTELLNDFHHQNFCEPDYWDESHNWSDDNDSLSDEYWHFLGSFE